MLKSYEAIILMDNCRRDDLSGLPRGEMRIVGVFDDDAFARAYAEFAMQNTLGAIGFTVREARHEIQ